MLAETLYDYELGIPTALTRLRVWLRRAKTRNSLRDLDARGLADVGLTEIERQRECARWFWQGDRDEP